MRGEGYGFEEQVREVSVRGWALAPGTQVRRLVALLVRTVGQNLLAQQDVELVPMLQFRVTIQ